jgi:cytochrome c biogenesis protein CcdA
LQRSITLWLARHARLVNLVGGVLLIAIAVYDMWVNWELIRLVLRF